MIEFVGAESVLALNQPLGIVDANPQMITDAAENERPAKYAVVHYVNRIG